MIVADNGSTGFLIGAPDARWSDSDLSCISNFTLSQVEPVNVSSLQINPDSGATSAAGSSLLAVSVAVPAAGAGLPYTAVLSGTVSDNVGVSSVAVSIDGRPYLPAVGTSSWSYALPALVVGPHTMSAQAWDASGNSAVSRRVAFTVSGTPAASLHAALVYPNPAFAPQGPSLIFCPRVVDSISDPELDRPGGGQLEPVYRTQHEPRRHGQRAVLLRVHMDGAQGHRRLFRRPARRGVRHHGESPGQVRGRELGRAEAAVSKA